MHPLVAGLSSVFECGLDSVRTIGTMLESIKTGNRESDVLNRDHEPGLSKAVKDLVQKVGSLSNAIDGLKEDVKNGERATL